MRCISTPPKNRGEKKNFFTFIFAIPYIEQIIPPTREQMMEQIKQHLKLV